MSQPSISPIYSILVYLGFAGHIALFGSAVHFTFNEKNLKLGFDLMLGYFFMALLLSVSYALKYIWRKQSAGPISKTLIIISIICSLIGIGLASTLINKVEDYKSKKFECTSTDMNIYISAVVFFYSLFLMLTIVSLYILFEGNHIKEIGESISEYGQGIQNYQKSFNNFTSEFPESMKSNYQINRENRENPHYMDTKDSQYRRNSNEDIINRIPYKKVFNIQNRTTEELRNLNRQTTIQ